MRNPVPWLVRLEQRNEEYVSAIKLTLLSLFYITLMASQKEGEHLSLGLGLSWLEVSIMLSIWYEKKKEEEPSHG